MNTDIVATDEQKTQQIDLKVIVPLIRNLFFNRKDVVAVYPSWNKPCPMEVDDIDRAIVAHLTGKKNAAVFIQTKKDGTKRKHQGPFRLGSYSAFEGITRWGVIDIDGGGGDHKMPVTCPDLAARAVVQNLKEKGVPAYVERSGSGTGYHVWVFQNEPAPASLIRKLLFSVIPSDVPMAAGGFADPRKNRGIEVFPKQDHPKEFGNMVWLPFYYNHRTAGNSRFYEVSDDGIGQPYMPDFQCLDVARLRELASEIGGDDVTSPTVGAVEVQEPKQHVIEFLRDRARPAVVGQGGDLLAFQIACDVVRGYSVDPEEAVQLIYEHYAPRCTPSVSDIAWWRTKVTSAVHSGSSPLGYLLKNVGSAWGSPTAIPSVFRPLPVAGEDMIPECARDWLTDKCERIGICLEYGFVSYLILASTLIGRKVGVYPRELDDWLVICNLWGVLVGPPSAKKSPAIRIATNILKHLTSKALKDLDQKLAAMRKERQSLETQIGVYTDMAKKALKSGKQAEFEQLNDKAFDLTEKLNNLRVEQKRHWTSDPSVEALIELFRKNPQGICLTRDELNSFLKKLNRTGSEGDRAAYLEMWDGNNPFQSDRIGRGNTYTPGMCLALYGGIQPRSFEKHVLDAISGDNDDGFVQRFQLLAYPDNPKPFKRVNRAPNKKAEQRIFKLMERLDDVSMSQFGTSTAEVTLPETDSGDELQVEIPAMRFNKEAQAVLDNWIDKIEIDYRVIERKCPAFGSHLAKFASFGPSLALIIHLSRWAAGESVSEKEVDLTSTLYALAWADLFRLNAEKVYTPAMRDEVNIARSFVEKIASKHIYDGIPLSYIGQGNWKRLDNAKDVSKAIEYLEARGWLRVEKPDDSLKTKGRPSSPVVRLNPALFSNDGHLRKDLLEEATAPSEAQVYQSEWLKLLPGVTPVKTTDNVVSIVDYRNEPPMPSRDLNTELAEAVKKNDAERVRKLIDEGAEAYPLRSFVEDWLSDRYEAVQKVLDERVSDRIAALI